MLRDRVPQFILALAVGLWLGGLTFYAGIVVPIGTEIIGGTEQGFITQRVTNWLNVFGLIAIFGLGVNVWWRGRIWTNVVTWMLIAALQLSLLGLHPLLDDQLDLANRTMRDASWFYACHRVYLILTAAIWLTGLAHVWLIGRRIEIPSEAIN